MHLDNDAEQTIAQLAGMLARREQWFPELPAGNGGALRERTEEALAAEIRGELAALRAAFPEEIARSLVALEHYAADNLGQVLSAFLDATRSAAAVWVRRSKFG